MSARPAPAAPGTDESTRWRGVLLPFLVLAVPMVASRLGLAGMGLADGWMIARLSPGGPEDLAAWTLVDGTLGRSLDVAVAFILPGLALVAQNRAQGRPDLAAAVWRRAMVMAVGAGLLATLVMPAMPWLLQFSPGAQAVGPQAGEIARALAWGFVAALLAMASAGYLEAMGRPMIPVLMVVLANGLKIGLNWVLIRGAEGLGVSGAEGCAWATTAVRFLMALVLTGLAWRMARPQLRRNPDSASMGRAQVERGLSAAGQSLVSSSLSLGIPLLLAGVALQMWTHWAAIWLLLLPLGILAWGLADAGSLRVAAMLGTTTGPALRRRCTWVMAGSAAVIGACTLPWWLWPETVRLLLGAESSPSADELQFWVGLAVLGMALDGAAAVVAACLRSLHVLWPTFWIQVAALAGQLLCLWVWRHGDQPSLAAALQIVILSAGLKLGLLWALFWQRSPGARPIA